MTNPKTSGSDRVSRWLLLAAGVALCVIALLTFLPGRDSPDVDTSNPTAASGETGDAPPELAEPDTAAAFHRLEGRWLRPDGGYVLDLRWVGADGRVEAKYLNPQPIFVSRAEASEDGDQIKVMVELQDRGYPGCVYTLRYDAHRDVLVGDYYQAAMRETFPVEFERTE